MLEEVPHRDEVEAARGRAALVEQAAVELDAAERRSVRQVDEVDAGDRGAGLVLARAARNVPAPQPTSSTSVDGLERRRSARRAAPSRVERSHRRGKSGASRPHRACGMRDVLVVVVAGCARASGAGSGRRGRSRAQLTNVNRPGLPVRSSSPLMKKPTASLPQPGSHRLERRRRRRAARPAQRSHRWGRVQRMLVVRDSVPSRRVVVPRAS